MLFFQQDVAPPFRLIYSLQKVQKRHVINYYKYEKSVVLFSLAHCIGKLRIHISRHHSDYLPFPSIARKMYESRHISFASGVLPLLIAVYASYPNTAIRYPRITHNFPHLFKRYLDPISLNVSNCVLMYLKR